MKMLLHRLIVDRPRLLVVLLLIIIAAIGSLLQSDYISALMKAPVHTIHITGAEGLCFDFVLLSLFDIVISNCME